MRTDDYHTFLSMPLDELMRRADGARRDNIGPRIEVCGVINAKSGACGEDCKFCAQSAHYATRIPEYPLKSRDEILSAAREAKKNGAEKFGIVTSGNKLTRDEINLIAEAIKEISQRIDITPCASLGALDEESFKILKDSGLERYHHNIETSERFYASIVSTHNYSERVNTIKAAKKAGLEVCSGGILGLGETWQDRIDMALLLKELEVDSVPLNFLVPIKGTPLENAGNILPEDALRIIAMFRIILGKTDIKIVAGRETVLKGFQEEIYSAGANGMMVGGYLTIAGRPVAEDRALLERIKRSWNGA